jgi:uncharacterized protein (DUF1778 family)
MEQDWFNLLSSEQISLAESNYDSLILELQKPKDPNSALAQAYKQYFDKYEKK